VRCRRRGLWLLGISGVGLTVSNEGQTALERTPQRQRNTPKLKVSDPFRTPGRELHRLPRTTDPGSLADCLGTWATTDMTYESVAIVTISLSLTPGVGRAPSLATRRQSQATLQHTLILLTASRPPSALRRRERCGVDGSTQAVSLNRIDAPLEKVSGWRSFTPGSRKPPSGASNRAGSNEVWPAPCSSSTWPYRSSGCVSVPRSRRSRSTGAFRSLRASLRDRDRGLSRR
jgi:hypothetical protein